MSGIGDNVPEAQRLSTRVLVAVYVRSLTLQASWNPQRMQNLGLLTTLLPWLERRGWDQVRRRRFFRRYYGFFNTNPYLANFVVGGLLRLESDDVGREGEGEDEDIVATFRDSLARTFASLGDQLFWLGVRPAFVLTICLLALLGWWVAILVVVAAFALGQLELRRRALLSGWQLGFDIVDLLGRPVWHRWISGTKRLAMSLTGVLAGFYFARVWLTPGPGLSGLVVLLVAAGLALPLVLRQRLPGEGLLLVAIPLAFAASFMF